jgi:proline iminopeptidase
MNTWTIAYLTPVVLITAAGMVNAIQPTRTSGAQEVRITVPGTTLYARSIGQGPPVIVLHGGPDFDHSYLLPDLDQFQDLARLIYYDQRGRGLSAAGVQPQDVTLATDVGDLDRVRQHYGFRTAALLGHSWGALLALEFALRHPTRVSHLILMNPAPVSVDGLTRTRKHYLAKLGADMERQREIVASAAYKVGDPEAVTARYRIHFKPALRRAEDLDRLMARMTAAFRKQGSAGILKARAVEDRLYQDTWSRDSFDLLPKLRALRIPALVIAGADDFIPLEVAEQIGRAIPGSKLVTVSECGHFAYLECADEIRPALDDFLRATKAP